MDSRYAWTTGFVLAFGILASAPAFAQQSINLSGGYFAVRGEDARVDGGPMFKRIRPVSRGMAYMIKRRMAHISVTLEDFSEL